MNEIFVYDEIGPAGWGLVDSQVFTSALNSFAGEDVTVRINSPGGDVFEALAILNAMKRYSGRVDVAIDSLAASAASIVAMGGESISIARNAYLMIHNPYTTVTGQAADFDHAAALLRKVTETIVDTYKDRTGQKASRARLKELLDAESYLTADESLALGLVTDVVDGLAIAANIGRPGLLKKLPAELEESARLAAGKLPSDVRAGQAKERLFAAKRLILKREIDLRERPSLTR